MTDPQKVFSAKVGRGIDIGVEEKPMDIRGSDDSSRLSCSGVLRRKRPIFENLSRLAWFHQTACDFMTFGISV